jgi:hypothetical protein
LTSADSHGVILQEIFCEQSITCPKHPDRISTGSLHTAAAERFHELRFEPCAVTAFVKTATMVSLAAGHISSVMVVLRLRNLHSNNARQR